MEPIYVEDEKAIFGYIKLVKTPGNCCLGGCTKQTLLRFTLKQKNWVVVCYDCLISCHVINLNDVIFTLKTTKYDMNYKRIYHQGRKTI